VDVRRVIAAALHGRLALAPARRVFLEDPRTFYVSISRAQWRDLPYGTVIDTAHDGGPAVWLDGPALVFPERRQLRVVELQGILARAVTRYEQALARAISSKSLRDEVTRKALADQQRYVRRCHVALVNLAIGYTWPGNPPGYIEFSDDE
jgi:hypothetical protein